MNKRFEIITIFLALVGVAIALFAWLAPFSPIGPSPLVRPTLATAMLEVQPSVTEIAPNPTDTLAPEKIRVGEPGVWIKSNNNPILVPEQSWERYIWHVYVMKDGNTYKMWYTASNSDKNHVGYATSSDGLKWVKYSGNPILAPGSSGEWDNEGVAEPYVIKSNGLYKMWYWGNSKGISQIGYAVSQDGITWEKYSGNPVLVAGNPGSWDEIEAGFPSIQYQDGTYKMWYTGKNANGKYALGYATSPDGINWEHYPFNPILSGTAGSWDEPGVLGARVLFDGNVYRTWYSRQDNGLIGYATSTDGISWNKSPNNPVLVTGLDGTWDNQEVYFPDVLYSDGIYMMWYGATNSDNSLGIGYAIATEVK